MNKKFFERDWGILVGEISKYRFDFLPRVTVSTVSHMMQINIGIFCFRLWLTIFDRPMQELNRRAREQREQ